MLVLIFFEGTCLVRSIENERQNELQNPFGSDSFQLISRPNSQAAPQGYSDTGQPGI